MRFRNTKGDLARKAEIKVNDRISVDCSRTTYLRIEWKSRDRFLTTCRKGCNRHGAILKTNLPCRTSVLWFTMHDLTWAAVQNVMYPWGIAQYIWCVIRIFLFIYFSSIFVHAFGLYIYKKFNSFFLQYFYAWNYGLFYSLRCLLYP